MRTIFNALHTGRMLTAVILSIWLLVFGQPCPAKIYKYQKDGTWHYTDTPPQDMPAEHWQEIESSSNDVRPPHATGGELLADFPTASAIERAAAATVYIETAIGSGSGFFISAQGHIITNKHVVRINKQAFQQTDTQFKQIQNQITEAEDRFASEEQRLRQYHQQLDSLARRIDSENNAAAKQHYEREHATREAYYEQWEADYKKRYERFDRQRKEFESKRSGYDYSKTVADLAQSFTITLADKSRHYARLIATSTSHDLALLKLDGYRTPALRKASAQSIAQGDPVYAIGSPAQLQNSVTSGVFSGFEKGFIQTNAQIYPGNSGGPLVAANGSVLGINTFKRITSKFEGLGFAIPVEVALKEFASYLQ